MNFPVWDPPMIGGGILIGIVAVLHVFVSHFAVGGGLFLVLTERRAYVDDDHELLSYVKKHSLFFILVTLVFGAVSGVGIWWTIGLVHPTATSTLIHVFVWAWAIEWVFFLVEIAAALFYYYGWERLDRRTHLIIGWIYAGAAWFSLMVINGILTFMLTPGRWLVSRNFWDAYFNPTMLPSLVTRTAVAVALAGLYALLTAAVVEPKALRPRVTRYAALWVLAGCAVIPFSGAWYISQIPPLARDISMGGAPAVTIFAGLSIALSALIVTITLFGPYRRPQETSILTVAMIAVLGLAVTGVTEWVREAVRKPYIIYGYMYSNALRLDQVAEIRQSGVLAQAKWVTVRDAGDPDWRRVGYEVFRTECRSCHTIDGYNGMRLMVKGWREEFVDYQLQHLNELKGFMPPFVGSDAERRVLARWLARLGSEQPFSEGLAVADGSGVSRQQEEAR
jgi:cytochrome bd-type quinol oxidase subunit 1